ncbi:MULTISPECIES: cytochrome C oxidase subunit II [unclassified Paenibacillus]|uniref:cytochrome C oxidase subunit II n=1 Tax=unclassified Paenibacillus TaxID=185978 RepID=UPI002F3FFE95
MKKWASLVAVALSLVLVLAACGSNDKGGNSDNGSTPSNSAAPSENTAAEGGVTIVASNWKFDKAEYKIKAGESIDMTVDSAEGIHGIKILKTDVNIENKQTVAVKIDEPGTYDIICNIPCGAGHAKMKAKLVVEA